MWKINPPELKSYWHPDAEKEIIEIDSVENRVLIFDTDISHKMKSATDAKRRIIINLNYIQK